jgi:hypothetical protein
MALYRWLAFLAGLALAAIILPVLLQAPFTPITLSGGLYLAGLAMLSSAALAAPWLPRRLLAPMVVTAAIGLLLLGGTAAWRLAVTRGVGRWSW